VSFVVAPRARQDLREIEDYSARRWGERQAAIYMADLDAGIDKVSARPTLGRAVPGAPGTRLFRVRSHYLVYRDQLDGGGIEFLRVLHQSMNFGPRLREP